MEISAVNNWKWPAAKGNYKIPEKSLLNAMFMDSLMRNRNNNGKALINVAMLLKCNTAYLARKLTEYGIDYKNVKANLDILYYATPEGLQNAHDWYSGWR